MGTHAYEVYENVRQPVRSRSVEQAAAEYAMIWREALDEEDLNDRLSSHAFEIAKDVADARSATKHGTVELFADRTRAAVCLNAGGFYVWVNVRLVLGTGVVFDDWRPSARAVSL